jgi:MFS family permease
MINELKMDSGDDDNNQIDLDDRVVNELDDDRIVTDDEPLDWKKMSVVAIVTFCEGFNGRVLIPFVPLMVQDFGFSEHNVGYVAGLITSCFFISQFVASFILGKASDKYGRRPIILLGLAGNAVAIALFGFSTNLAVAIYARFLNGLVNGNTACIKAYIVEVSTVNTQAMAYSIRSAGYALGSIAGPALGGYLSSYAVGSFQYALPCLVGSALSLLGLALGYAFLQETVRFDDAHAKMHDNSARSWSDTLLEFVGALRERNVRLTIMLYMLYAFADISFDEVIALFALRSVENKGLGFSSSIVGMAQAIGGAFMLAFQLGAYRFIDRRFGSLLTFIASAMVAAAAYTATPFATLLLDVRWLAITIVTLCVSFKLLSTTSAFAAINLLISNASPPGQLGIVNGLGASAASLARLIAPVTAGSLFAATTSLDAFFPFDFHFVFLLIAALALCCSLIAHFALPTSINKRRFELVKATTELAEGV